MCGRVRLSSDYSEIKIRLKFAPDAPAPNYEPDWNKPPTADMLVAIRSVDGKRVAKIAILILPGLALAYAMNSGTVLAGNDGWTAITLVVRMMLAIGARSRIKLKLSLS